METKKYTTHSAFWWNIFGFILWVILLTICIIWKSSAPILIGSVYLVYSLVMAIRCRLAWHAYVEISEEGVKMKGCAKRISEHKKENVDDIFIPWEDIEEINGGINGPVLELKTGERIILTQQIDVNSRTFRKAFEKYKSKQPEQTRDSFEVVGVYKQDSNRTNPNE